MIATAGVEHAVANAVSFAAIAGIFHEPQRGIFCREVANNVSGVVARAVIDDDDFGVPLLEWT